jgi:hypothetical protein
MMDGFTSLEEDKDEVILCKPVETGSPPPPLHSGVVEGYNYFGDLPNPDPEDDSPRSHKGDFSPTTQGAAAGSTSRKKLTSSALL